MDIAADRPEMNPLALHDAIPYPPRVEVSALGEAAVLTGALATGVQAARENLLSPR